jgi:hypothetical protein
MLKIPLSIVKQLLPDENLSVIKFLQFKFPITSTTKITDPKLYLSSEETTTTDINVICATPSPPITVVQHLLKAFHQAPEDTSSILCAHLGRTNQFPICIITFWTEVVYLCTVQASWAKAQASLQEQRFANDWKRDEKEMVESHKLLDEVNLVFSCISWKGSIQGFDLAVLMESLACYATPVWLTNVQEDQMLDLLHRELHEGRGNQLIIIESTQFFTKLKSAHRKHSEYQNNPTAQEFRWVHGQGQRFRNGLHNLLGMIVNIGNQHWVVIIVDFKTDIIWHGDLMGNSIKLEICEAILWWIHIHTGHCFDIKDLPITRQRDGYLCGLLAWNMLVVFFLETKYSLMDPNDVDDKQLRVLLCVVHIHEDFVCYNMLTSVYILIGSLVSELFADQQ